MKEVSIKVCNSGGKASASRCDFVRLRNMYAMANKIGRIAAAEHYGITPKSLIMALRRNGFPLPNKEKR